MIAEEDFDRNYGDNQEILNDKRVGKETRKKWKEALDKTKEGTNSTEKVEKTLAQIKELMDAGHSLEQAMEMAHEEIDSLMTEDL